MLGGLADQRLGLVQQRAGGPGVTGERMTPGGHLRGHSPHTRRHLAIVPACRIGEPDAPTGVARTPRLVGLHAECGGGHVHVADLQCPVMGAVVPGERGGLVIDIQRHPRDELGVLRGQVNHRVGERAAGVLDQLGHHAELPAYDPE